MIRLVTAGLGTGAALLAVTGCSHDSGPTTETLRIGDTATIDDNEQLKIQAAVTTIDTGSSADLNELQNPSKYAGKTPYYVRYRLTTTASSATAPSESFVAFAGSKQLTHLSVIPSLDVTNDPEHPLSSHSFDKCKSAATDKLKNAPAGQSVDGCIIFLSDNGDGAPTKVQWGLKKTPAAVWKP
ncbi:hypothetical protein [Streptomyces sp. UNOC14_S4]|uniref:hypothetical protein n=1 Tax=Streptomyces sp. UNOC14_S4 TaxID=2872340 RepID=UPI001E4EF06A|nr:hypothetical protein [Streptomyces sp. UNOC14_S4]MCC3768819.1 hypothetical protein [Streptomyces sp. UNOC14_S4]